MRPIAAGAFCALLATQPACIHNIATGIPATGEPLSVEFASTYRQGKDPIDELDFYRIAGDVKSANKIQSQRDRGTLYNRLGLALLTIGLGGLVVSSITDGDWARRGTAATVLMPIGGVLTFYGRSVADERGIVSSDFALEAANRYNGRRP
jgi:hypothetical protein